MARRLSPAAGPGAGAGTSSNCDCRGPPLEWSRASWPGRPTCRALGGAGESSSETLRLAPPMAACAALTRCPVSFIAWSMRGRRPTAVSIHMGAAAKAADAGGGEEVRMSLGQPGEKSSPAPGPRLRGGLVTPRWGSADGPQDSLPTLQPPPPVPEEQQPPAPAPGVRATLRVGPTPPSPGSPAPGAGLCPWTSGTWT